MASIPLLEAWAPFFSTETESAATLIGLLFVAVSLNFEMVFRHPHLVPRVAKAFVSLAGVFLMASCCLMPAQGLRVPGVEVTGLGTLLWIALSATGRRSVHHNPHIGLMQKALQWVLMQSSMALAVGGGALLCVGRPQGLVCVAVGALLVIAMALLDAWVLLIEIRR